MKSNVATICAVALLSFALLTGCTMQITSNQQTPAPTAAPTATQTSAQPTVDKTAAPEVSAPQAQQEVQNPQDDVRYENAKYGLLFDLPETWRGFSVVEETWEGIAVDGKDAGKVVETGPKLSIRHPAWTKENPRQDIPILVFTPKQWDAIQKEALSVSAAPIPPSELGHNASYVFALPARYNFAFLTGFEEVEQIVKSNPIREITIIEENKDIELGC